MIRKQKRQFYNSIPNQIELLSDNNPNESWIETIVNTI